jgi:hypothetical protein
MCACVPEHAQGVMSAPALAPSKQKRHDGRSSPREDDVEGFVTARDETQEELSSFAPEQISSPRNFPRAA